MTLLPTHCYFNLAENLAADFHLVIPPHQQTIPFVWHMIQKSQLLFASLPIPIYKSWGTRGLPCDFGKGDLKSCRVWGVCLADVQRKKRLHVVIVLPAIAKHQLLYSMQNKDSRLSLKPLLWLYFFFLLQCQNALRHTSALKTTISPSISSVKAFFQAFRFEKTRKTRKGEWAQDNQACGSCDKKK